MKKSNAKEKICGLDSYAALAVLTVAACWFFAGRYGVFGANMDWISQHSVFPEYFRQQFYQTGQFFPEYAANIGGGQNIYNFSYYGLYNPIVLIAYLLPFAKMSDYLMAASVICLAASVCLLYGWLKKRRFSTEIALGVAVLFLLAGPMIYQSCHQIMFVQYMPFLLMAFSGVDRYWEKGKTGLYTLGVFLMILTSFYFSIAGMAALFLYGWYGYPKGIRKRKLFGFLVPMIVAVLSAGVLLVPTAYAILQRSGSSKSQNLKELLMPKLQLDSSLYGTYSVGLTVVLVAVLLGGIVYGTIRERLVSVACVALLTVPVFAWGFNGMLYVRYKSLIPFLPFFCYLTAVFLNRMKNGEIGRWKGAFIFGGTVGVSLLPDLSEVETPVPASCPGTGMPGADQSCGERKSRQSGAERRLSGDHRQCLAGCRARCTGRRDRSVPDGTERSCQEAKRQREPDLEYAPVDNLGIFLGV